MSEVKLNYTINNLKKKKNTRLLHFVLLLFISVIILTVDFSTKKENIFSFVIQNTVSVLNNLSVQIYEEATEVNTNLKLSAQLNEEISLLKKKLIVETTAKNLWRHQYQELYAKNELIQTVETPDEYKIIVASVIGIFINQTQKYFLINKGLQQGIKQKDMVTTGAGVIGLISEVYLNQSKVLLINDPNHHIPLMIAKNNFKYIGESIYNSDNIIVKDIPFDENIEVGDEIVTSGLGGVYLKGLMIGKVASIIQQEQGLNQIFISLHSNLTLLEHVVILIEK